MPTLTVNGEQRTLPDPLTIAELLEALGQHGEGRAVAVNLEVVPRARWASHSLNEGDSVDIVQAVGGG